MRVEVNIKYKNGEVVKVISTGEIDVIRKSIVLSNKYRGFSNYYYLSTNKRKPFREIELIKQER